jgi:hypothetical protein
MEQPATILPEGTKIRTHAFLPNRPELPGERTPNIVGTILGVLPGTGGDVYRVRQDDGGIGSYCWDEFEIVSARPTVGILARLLAQFEQEPANAKAIAALPDIGEPDKFLSNAARATISLSRSPWSAQDKSGGEAWKTMALLGAYALLRAVYAANESERG